MSLFKILENFRNPTPNSYFLIFSELRTDEMNIFFELLQADYNNGWLKRKLETQKLGTLFQFPINIYILYRNEFFTNEINIFINY